MAQRTRPIIIPNSPAQEERSNPIVEALFGQILEGRREKRRKQESLGALANLIFGKQEDRDIPVQLPPTGEPPTPPAEGFPAPVPLGVTAQTTAPLDIQPTQEQVSLLRNLTPQQRGALAAQGLPQGAATGAAATVPESLRTQLGEDFGIDIPEGVTFEQLKAVGIKAQVPKETGDIFAKVNIQKFTSDSVAVAEKSGLRSDLKLRPEVLKDMANDTNIAATRREDNLRKEFVKDSATFRDVRDSIARVQAATKDPSAAGDLAVIFGYMKILDPRSIVRESEQATAENARGVPGKIRALYNKLIKGEKLTPEQRKDFVTRAEALFERQEAQHKQREKTFTGLATRGGLDVRNIVVDLNDPLFQAFKEDRRIEELEIKERQP